jgi:LuxR family transcriptional regulator, maltose regulon positive regulatory protein
MTIETRAKVMAPQVSPFAVFRADLVRRLDEAVRSKVTLLVAPPGYGKSMLLAQWAAASARRRIAWLTLDSADGNAVTFARSLITSLQTVHADVGLAAAERIGTSGASMGDEFVFSLLDDLAHVPDTVIVFDDVETVRNGAVLDELAVLVEQAPACIRVVLSSRSDPPLALHRLRVRGELTELRQDQLKISEADAAEVIRRVARTGLSPAQVHVLVRRTEGWPAGILMAALSLRGRTNADEFVQTFSGDDRNVADYLADEVLARQPTEVREFLLDTSVLRRMSGPLCDAVTERTDSQRILEHLERSGLFVVRLDDRRRWFRYHSLLRDLLRFELRASDRARQRERLKRAAAWHIEQNDLEIAADYLVASELWDELIGFLRAHGRSLVERGTIGAVSGWLEYLPDEIASRSDVQLTLAATHTIAGRTLAADEILARVDRTCQLTPLEGAFSDALRAGMVQFHLPADRALEAADRGLRRLDGVASDTPTVEILGLSSPDYLRGALKVSRGRALHDLGEIAAAYDALSEVVEQGQGPFLALNVAATGSLAVLAAQRGELNRAQYLAVRALHIARQSGLESRVACADAYIAFAQFRRERNQLDRAAMSLDEAHHRIRRNGRHVLLWLHTVEAALLALAQEQPDAGLALLTQRRVEGQPPPSPYTSARIVAVEARLFVAAGDAPRAMEVLDAYDGLRVADIAVAETAAAVAARDLESARKVLARFPEAETRRSLVEHLLWKAIVEDLDGEHRLGRELIQESVTNAEREGLARVYLDAGTHGWRLLRSLYHVEPSPFLRHLVDQPVAPPPPQATVVGIVEQLSDREILVVRYLPSRLSNPEIARNLYVSVNTLKTHLKHIYRKLGVANRSEAIEMAESLGLL